MKRHIDGCLWAACRLRSRAQVRQQLGLLGLIGLVSKRDGMQRQAGCSVFNPTRLAWGMEWQIGRRGTLAHTHVGWGFPTEGTAFRISRPPCFLHRSLGGSVGYPPLVESGHGVQASWLAPGSSRLAAGVGREASK